MTTKRNTAYFKMPFFLADTNLNLGERVLYAYLLNGTHIFPDSYTPTLSGMAHHLGVSRVVARKILNSLIDRKLVSISDTGVYTVSDASEHDDIFI